MRISFDFSIFTGAYFDSSVFLYAGIVGVLTSLCASVLGVNLVLKRYSMIGDGLSHVGFLALALAALLGIGGGDTLYITVPVVVLAAFFLMWLSESGKLKGDAATALVSVGTVAAGYVIFGLAEAGAGDVCAGLFGASVLTIDRSDALLCTVLCGAVMILYLVSYNKIFAATFDEPFAKAAGVNTKAYNMLLSVFIAVTVVVGMKLIGSIMISAVVVIPAVAAMRLFKTFRAAVVCSACISVLCFLLGFLFSVTFVITKTDSVLSTTVMLPIGATVVCFHILALIAVCAVTAFRKRRTIL